jgi:hypothetical protein
VKRFYAQLTACFFGWWWVWTQDHNGVVRLRRVRCMQFPFDTQPVYRVVGLATQTACLRPDGVFAPGGPGYLKRWAHYAGVNQLAETGRKVRDLVDI